MSYDNPNGAATMPAFQAADMQRPPLLGGLPGRLLTSDPAEPRTI